MAPLGIAGGAFDCRCTPVHTPIGAEALPFGGMFRPLRAIRALLSALIVGTNATTADQPRDHHIDHDHLPELGSSQLPSDRVADAGASGASGGATPGLTWTESMTSKVTMSGELDLVVIRPTPADDPS
jgi:hypothetical protein